MVIYWVQHKKIPTWFHFVKFDKNILTYAIVKKLQLSLVYVLQFMSKLQNVIWGITSHFDKWFHKRMTLNFFEYFNIVNEIHVRSLTLEFHK